MASKMLWWGILVVCQVTQASITQFNLFTRRNGLPEIISDRNLSANSSSFNPKLKLTFIIHGYLQHGRLAWVGDMRRELMKREIMNIVVVDWGRGSGLSDFSYNTAVQNTRLVAAHIAKLIGKLHRIYNYDLSKIHVIGHSLGAHVAGFVGAKVTASQAGKKLGRITGLDPARPNFNHNNDSGRLDPSDAQFVDVIHTDIGNTLSLGLARPCGHVDFYPNGGNDQPGCVAVGGWRDLFSPANMVTKFINIGNSKLPLIWQFVCNHMKVLYYFTASINNNCSRKAFPCRTWKAFKRGRCFDCRGACAEMGYNADQHYRGTRVSRKYYLKTLNSHPYCAPRYYHVTLYGLRFRFSYSFGFGINEIKIRLKGKNGVIMVSNPSTVNDGTRIIKQMIVSNVNPGPLKSISILYKGSQSLYVGSVTVQGPGYKYMANYNTYMAPMSFFFSSFKTYTTTLRKVT